MSDLIDRQALLRQIDIDSDGEPGYYGDTWKFIDTIKRMPSALGTNLAEDGTDCISRQAIDAVRATLLAWSYMPEWRDNKVIEAIKRLPPIQPAEPKRGKWIDKGITGDWQYQIDGRGRSWHEWQCDQCKDMVKKRSFYCPNCGADMRGEQDG